MALKHYRNYVLLLALLASYCSVQAQSYQWGKQFGDGEMDRIVAMEVDSQGNSYLLGTSDSYYFDINPGPATEIIENNGLTGSAGNICFLVKLDLNGNYLWSKVFNYNRSSSDYVADIKIGTDGNLYVGMVLYQYFGSQVITNANIVIAKLDQDGNELMVKSIKDLDGTPSLNFHSFDLDADNNIYISGYFIDHVTLAPSNPALNFAATGWGNYIIKMNSSGNYLWQKSNDYQQAYFDGVKTAPDGHLNYLLYSVDSATNTPSLYLYNLDPADGHTIWSKNFGVINPMAFCVMPNGNIVLSLHSNGGAVDLDPSSAVVASTGNQILLWLDGAGNYLDHKQYNFASSSDVYFNVIRYDNNNSLYITSNFTGTVDADPSPDTYMLTAWPSQFGEAFVVKLNPDRTFAKAFKLGQANNPPTMYDNIYRFKFYDIEVRSGVEYYCGVFAGYADLDPTPATAGFEGIHDNATTTDDGFVFKLKLNTMDVSANTKDPDITLYPNPAEDHVFLAGIQRSSASIYEASGRLVKHIPSIADSKIDVSDLKTGIYFIRFYQDNRAHKFVKR